MADASATYTLNFDGNMAAGAQNAATSANALADSLGRLEAAAGKAGAAAGTAGGAGAKLGGAIGGAGGAIKSTGAAAGGASINLRALGGALTRTGGEAGQFLGHGVRIVALLGRLATSPVGIAIAVGVMTLAIVAAGAAFVGYAIHAADAARTQGLFAEAATGSAEAGDALLQQAGKLAGVTGLTNAKIRDMGLELARAGLEGQILGATLEASAIAASTLGDAAGAKIKGIAEAAVKAKSLTLNALSLKGTGVGLDDVARSLAEKMNTSFAAAKGALQDGRVKVGAGLDALNDAINEKLGGIAKKQALGLTAQFAHFGENIGDLFAGMNIEPLLGSLHDVLSVFDQSTESGKALGVAVRGIAQPLIDGLTYVLPLAKGVFQGLISGALDVAIVMLRIRLAVGIALKGSSLDAGDFATAMTVGKVAAIGLAVTMGAIAAAVLVVGAGVAILGAVFALPFILAGAAIYGLYAAFVAVWGGIKSFWAGLDLAGLGTSIIDGLVNGITSGAGAVWGAIKSIGEGIKNAFSVSLDMHSPSKVFHGYGMNTAIGYAEGVDAGAPDVNAAVTGMVGAPPALPAGGGAKGRSGPLVVIERVEYNGGSKADADDFILQLCNTIERTLVGIGAPLEPAK